MRPSLPWRVRKVISDRLPLLHHLIADVGTRGNSVAHWNRRLQETGDDDHSAMSRLFVHGCRAES